MSTYSLAKWHGIRLLGSVVLSVLVSTGGCTRAKALAGLWDATVAVNGVTIPFRFELTGAGSKIAGSFFNGDERITSSSGNIRGGVLTLRFDDYGSILQATLTDGELDGHYDRGVRGVYPFHAKRFSPPQDADGEVPSIAGLWTILTKPSPGGEAAWRMIVRQSGPEISAAILRVDGDTGALTGRYVNGVFTLSHFSGARPLLVELSLEKDGTLQVVENRGDRLTAVRTDEAKARGLPEPADPSRFTSIKDPSEPFRFSFPGLDGSTVSSTDPRFRGKVLLVSITGSWCPNCHDEAPFLTELYRTYHERGLEIVALAFEEADQLKNPTRLRAFIDHFHLEYPVLLAGEPRQLSEKVPQAVNLSSFPTSIFVGRDGLVRGVHSGFAGRVTGPFYAETREEIIREIERLLAEPVRPAA
jgi:thiol-disulfide isomerase/thioredoxin